MPFARSHGADIYYERHGSGPAVLFCHGAGSNAATWWQQVPEFSRRFCCLIYDHRGFGRSRATADSITPEQLVADALAILDAEKVDGAALVCQSLGGFTGVRVALRHPGRVWAFASCDSPLGVAHPPMLESVARYLASAGVTRLEERALGRGYVEAKAALAFLYGQINGFNPTVFGGLPGAAGWARQLRTLLSPPHLLPLEHMARIACPTLFIAGEHDPLVTPLLSRELARHVRGSEFAEIAGAGHSPYFEQPEAFNARVLDFLGRAAAAPGAPS
jgi:3-oxoadipate enol-lactonase